MKSIIYLFAILVSTGAFAQSNYVTEVMDNPYGQYQFLYELPWDQSQLVQVEEELVALPQYHSVYKFETISNGLSSPWYIPFCAELTTAPVFLDDGILATGTTPLNGVECVFFDGSNTIEFDLNIGSDNSDPVVSVLGEQVFIIGYDGNARQLYEFDKVNHTVTLITNTPIDINAVYAVWGDDVYYGTVFSNTAFSQTEYSLIKASLSNGVYTYSTVRTVSIPFGVDRHVNWGSPILKWNKLFLTQANYSFVSGVMSDLEVLSIDDNAQVSVVHQAAQSERDGIFQFEWDDALWMYVAYSNELYVCRNGVSFGLDLNTGAKTLSSHHITGNNKLFLDLYIPSTDDHEIAAHYGTLQTIYTGDHMHILKEENEILYLSDWKWYDSSSIVLIHTAFDGVEEIYIDQAGAHSPIPNASLVHNGEFTFLFAYDFADVSVLKLTGSPSAGIDELSVELRAYPNPVVSGASVILETPVEGVAQLLTMDGRLVERFNLTSGKNFMETSALKSGMYIVSFLDQTLRIVVE